MTLTMHTCWVSVKNGYLIQSSISPHSAILPPCFKQDGERQMPSPLSLLFVVALRKTTFGDVLKLPLIEFHLNLKNTDLSI